jgi:hypothetical protein
VIVGNDTMKGTHKLDPTKKPKTIDVQDTEGSFKDQTLLGIYRILDDEFSVCFAAPGKERPSPALLVFPRHVSVSNELLLRQARLPPHVHCREGFAHYGPARPIKCGGWGIIVQLRPTARRHDGFHKS